MKPQILAPKFLRARKRWVIDVPKSLNNGKRRRFFFQSQEEATRAQAEMFYSLTKTGEMPTRAETKESVAYFSSLFLAQKAKQVEKVTLRQLKWALNKFSERFGAARPQEVDAVEVKRWVERLPLEPRGRFNVFAVCRDFFNSPEVRGLVKQNPFCDPPQKRGKHARLPILTVDQMRALLAQEWPQWFKVWLVAGGFAGMRTREIFAVDFSAFDWEYDEIVIRREEAKQGEAARPRSATMQEAFKRHMPRGKGKLTEGATDKLWRPWARQACRVIGLTEEPLEWPTNCLRHSFASYHLAHFRDASKTAFEMGTSPDLLYATYANLVSRRDAEKWWAL
jgi:integrase